MKLMLTNHHLEDRGGSELYCLELASSLQRVGHEVAVFTLRPGRISDELARRGVTIFTAGDDERIEAFEPDILHVHHAPCLYYLGALRLRAKAVFSSLGIIPALEAAPIVWAGVAQGLAVSEEVLDALRSSRFGAEVPLAVFRNWFDDTGLVPDAPGQPEEARRIAVVSNHLDQTLARDLDALRAAHPGLEWTHFGYPNNSVEMSPELLRGFDRVITIGRTALLAAALQKPCLLYDVHGCDGLMTPERLDAQASRNFSGRLTRSRPSRQELEHLLLDEARRVDVAALAKRIWREYPLSRRVEELLAFYTRLLEGKTALGEQTRSAYGREGTVYTESLLGRLHAEARESAFRNEFHGLQRETEALRRETETLRRENEALRHESEARAGEMATLREGLETERTLSARLRTEVGQLADALAMKEAESTHLGSELAAIRSSLAWELVGRVRGIKDQFIALPGSRRRLLYDRLLHRFKRRLGGGYV
ncbi:glycosyltransferase [Archangium gephyra]|uniref:glycosyltransferase n=1 Tax=Archangium gephyra TaxID=48 RepID=UPI0035D4C7A5